MKYLNKFVSESKKGGTIPNHSEIAQKLANSLFPEYEKGKYSTDKYYHYGDLLINESRIHKFDDFVNEDKEWTPKTDEVSIILNYLKINYPIKDKTLRIGKSESVKYIMIDDKPHYLDGFLANKTRTRRKLYQEIKYEFENFQDSSINKAIKIYINEEL